MDNSDIINLVAAILIGGGTLTLAYMTWKSIRQTRSIHETERKERLLNEIAKWSADVRKYCASLDIGFNTQLERIQAAEKYLTLKFDGKNLLVSVKEKTL